MNELNCAVVTDLLPSYAEGLTGEETNRLVEAHLAGCPACREALDAMRSDAPAENLSEPEQTEIEFLKKNRRRNRRILLGSIAAALALAAVLLLLKFFVIGSRAADDGVLIRLDIDGHELTVECSAWNEDRVVSSVVFSEPENGTVDVTARTALKSPFFRDMISKTYTAKADIERVTFNSKTVLSEAGSEMGKLVVSEKIKQAIRASWEEYNAMTPEQQSFYESTPGYCAVPFDTWEEAVDYLRFTPWNPFEENEAFVKKNFAGTDVPLPDGVKHVMLTFDGSEDGQPAYMDLDAGYSLNGVRVVYSASTVEMALVKTIHGDTVVVVDPAAFPFGEATASYVAPEGYIFFRRDSTEKYESETLYFRLGSLQYSVRLTADKGEDADLYDALRTVQMIVENAIRNG